MTALLLESLHPEAEAALAARGAVMRAVDPNAPPSDIATVEAILTRGRGRIGADLLSLCPKLRVVARAGTGLDNVDTQAAARLGIPVIYAPGANADTVAEHTLALILASVRGIVRVANWVRAGRWEERRQYGGQEVRGQRLGIVGFGAVGRRTAELARAFGMQVAVAVRGESAATSPFPILPLDALLAQSDVVCFHVPLTPGTPSMVGPRRLALMKAGAVLINTSRGGLVDEGALLAALRSGHLAGYAADVLDQEPPNPDHPLLGCESVILTPHIASLTGATYRRMCVNTVHNVLAVLDGRDPEPGTRFVARP